MAIPQMPDKRRIAKVTRTIIEESLKSLCLNLLCEANWDMVAPKIHHVKKHSLAAQIHDCNENPLLILAVIFEKKITVVQLLILN